MKDKEMVEERTKEYMKEHAEKYNCENTKLETDNYNVGLEQGYEDGFLAGLNAGATENGIKWHDLRKNPNDLPKENCKVYLYAKDKEYYIGFLENGAWKYEGGFYASDNFVIAWCEIPTFGKENE